MSTTLVPDLPFSRCNLVNVFKVTRTNPLPQMPLEAGHIGKVKITLATLEWFLHVVFVAFVVVKLGCTL
jgi:hypothetical protein